MERAAGVRDNEAGPAAQTLFASVNRRLGRVAPGTRVRAIDPKFLRASVEMDF